MLILKLTMYLQTILILILCVFIFIFILWIFSWRLRAMRKLAKKYRLRFEKEKFTLLPDYAIRVAYRLSGRVGTRSILIKDTMGGRLLAFRQTIIMVDGTRQDISGSFLYGYVPTRKIDAFLASLAR